MYSFKIKLELEIVQKISNKQVSQQGAAICVQFLRLSLGFSVVHTTTARQSVSQQEESRCYSQYLRSRSRLHIFSMKQITAVMSESSTDTRFCHETPCPFGFPSFFFFKTDTSPYVRVFHSTAGIRIAAVVSEPVINLYIPFVLYRVVFTPNLYIPLFIFLSFSPFFFLAVLSYHI